MRCAKLRRISPAPISSTTASAISIATIADDARRAAAPTVTRDEVSCSLVCLKRTVRAETTLKMVAVTTVSRNVTPSTPRLIPTSRIPGASTDGGTSDTSAGRPQ